MSAPHPISRATHEAHEPASSRNDRLGYVAAIDGLRAVAVLAVIVFHLRPLRLPGGMAGVDLFFVISGFVVTASLRGMHFARVADLVSYFFARRVLRILPALAAMLVLTSLLAVLFIPNAGTMTAIRQVGIAAAGGASNIHLAFSRVTYFGTSADHNAFLHTWTLGVEEQFYLLFPFLYFLWHRPGLVTDKRRGLAIVAGCSVLSLLACGWLSQGRNEYAFFLMPSRFWELGAGMLLAQTIDIWRPRLTRAATLPCAIGWVVSLTALAVVFQLRAFRHYPFPLALLAVAGAAGLIVLACARPESPVARLLSHPLPVYIGRISYSLYLWHWPTFVLFRWTVGLDGRLKAGCALLTAFVLANASYFLLERPIRHARRLGSLRRRWILIGGVLLMLASAGTIVLLFRFEARLTRSTGYLTYFAGAAPPGPCAVEQKTQPFADGTLFSWTPTCASPSDARRLVIIGDSHALAYTSLGQHFASKARVPVHLYYKLGCGFPALMSAQSERPHCVAFHRAVRAALPGVVSPGDILFLPALRITRAGSDSVAGYAEARTILSELSLTEARLVLEAPKPMFDGSLYRCLDWFNRTNPECRPALFQRRRADAIASRAPVMALMERLVREVPGTEIFDPLPVLCPLDPCGVWRDGKPLYFDGNHISGQGADLLTPSFLKLANVKAIDDVGPSVRMSPESRTAAPSQPR